MKKVKLTRSLLAACSIVALTAVMYGCVHDGDGDNGTQTGTEMPEPTPQEQIVALQTQINELRAELGLDPIDIDDLTGSVTQLTQQVADLQKQVDDAAEDARKEKEDADRKAAAEAAATAAKLYGGIYAPAADASGTGTDDVFAAYNTGDTAIEVTIGTGGDSPAAGTAVTLSEDKKTMVAANHGWAGKRYADAAGDDEYEAMVYSDVKAPTQGKKFGGAAANDEYEYALTDGALPLTTINANPGRVTLSGVTRTAGTETFELPDPNPNNEQDITVSGSYHGVSGTYSCDTGAARTDACTAMVAAEGFTLTGAWTFTPSSAEARVMDSADTMYASYGWWIKKAENDGPFTASAFVDYKGGDGSAELAGGIDALNGAATYMGGAAGKYALASSTGGTNDAGHFTARATLEANFTNNTEATAITGTIDDFIGADGMSRDGWSVKLNGSPIANAGTFGDAEDGTEWTIDGTAAADSGSWSGRFYDAGDDLVPDVATGTFYSTYGTAGKMVGAFGANEQ
ncbi:MAG: hypothetical protein OXI75_03450 [Rhodospirillales bacterium]|nr:hypothetical protein [Rhodospirillales bacterium]